MSTEKRKITKFQVIENISLGLKAAEEIGCTIMNVKPQDIAEGRVSLLIFNDITHPLIGSFISFSYSFVNSLIDSLSPIIPFIRSLIHISTHFFFHSFIHYLIHSFIVICYHNSSTPCSVFCGKF